MKDNVDLVEGGCDRVAVTHIAFNKLNGRIDPRGFTATMRVWLEVIEHANFPALTHEKIGQMRPDKAGATGNESAFAISRHALV
jgi:hypothetical protein